MPRLVTYLAAMTTAAVASLSIHCAAGASEIGGVPILPDATISGSVGIGIAANGAVLTGPGMASLPAAFAGDWGFASLQASLGASPTIAITYDSVKEFQGSGGGAGSLTLNYWAQYYNPNAVAGSTVDATLFTGDSLFQSGSSSVSAQLFIEGPTGVIFLAQHCQSGRNGCDGGGNSFGSPFPASANIQLLQNVNYRVNLLLQVSGFGIPPVDGIANGVIDPSFSAPAGVGGRFIFSPGVTGTDAVPEPAAWSLVIAGFALAGAALRRRPLAAAPTSVSGASR